MAACNRKTKIAAFANDSEKLIMPPRSSFGRYIVLNLASEGKIKPTHAWKMQNSITNVPISW